MNTSALPQTIGNLCAGLATLIFLLPLQHVMRDYARKHLNNDQWVTPVLFILIPLWLLLMGALLSVTASGGFDWLRLGRPLLYALTVAATFALAFVSFVSIALYIRPGFTPRSLYCPLIYLVPFATVLLVVLSLNPKLTSGLSMHWLRLPWTIFAALSLVASVGFFGYRTLRIGVGGVMGVAHRIRNPSPSSEDILAQISNLDPQRDFVELLRRAGPGESRAVREAVAARLRTNPQFIETLTATLNSRDPSNGLGYLHSTTLSPVEQNALALPARNAIERFTSDIPAPNYMSPDRRKQLLRWGRKAFPVIIEKFSSTDVDFTQVMPAFEHALRPDDTRR